MTVTTKKSTDIYSLWQRISMWLDKENVMAGAFITPSLIILILFVAYPFVVAIYLSFTNRTIGGAGGYNFVGLKNYIYLLNDDIFLKTAVNTFNYTFVAVIFKLFLGMLMALVLHEVKYFKNIFRGALLLPWVIPTSLSTLIWLWMFDSQYSVFNWILLSLGLIEKKIIWLGFPATAMMSVQIINIWRGIPFFGISLLAGLQTIPEEMYEAAEIDGANAWRRFWAITIPFLKPVTIVTTLFSIITTFADFQIVYVLTKGGPVNSTHLFATLTHNVAILAGQLGRGAAVSLFIFPVLVIVVIIQLRSLQTDQ